MWEVPAFPPCYPPKSDRRHDQREEHKCPGANKHICASVAVRTPRRAGKRKDQWAQTDYYHMYVVRYDRYVSVNCIMEELHLALTPNVAIKFIHPSYELTACIGPSTDPLRQDETFHVAVCLVRNIISKPTRSPGASTT